MGMQLPPDSSSEPTMLMGSAGELPASAPPPQPLPGSSEPTVVGANAVPPLPEMPGSTFQPSPPSPLDLGAPPPPPPAPAQSGGNRTLIIVLVVLLVLCCCCALIGASIYLYQNGDKIFGLAPSPRSMLPLLGLAA